jgi:hypothetical protein
MISIPHSRSLAVVGFAMVLCSAGVANAANQLSFYCSSFAVASWPSEQQNQSHPLTLTIGPGDQIPSHTLQIDLAKGTALVDVAPGVPNPHNNPFWGEIKSLRLVNGISVFNVMPSNHANDVQKLTIMIDGAARTFTWQTETMNSANVVIVTSVERGVCDTPKQKF